MQLGTCQIAKALQSHELRGRENRAGRRYVCPGPRVGCPCQMRVGPWEELERCGRGLASHLVQQYGAPSHRRHTKVAGTWRRMAVVGPGQPRQRAARQKTAACGVEGPKSRWHRGRGCVERPGTAPPKTADQALRCGQRSKPGKQTRREAQLFALAWRSGTRQAYMGNSTAGH